MTDSKYIKNTCLNRVLEMHRDGSSGEGRECCVSGGKTVKEAKEKMKLAF